MTDYLFFASNFNKWAGPNNHLLDLSNYLYNDLCIDVRLITHDIGLDSSFLKQVRFPLLPVLSGSASSSSTRFLSAFSNERIIKKLIQTFQVSKKNLFVNASIDTLFEVSYAAKSKISVGYNAIGNDANSVLFNFLDRLAARTSINKIVASTDLQKEIYLNIGFKENMIHVIPHCISLKRIEESAKSQETEKSVCQKTAPVIFYGGRLSVEKGVKDLIDCYVALSAEFRVDLVIIGDGPLREWVFEKKKELENASGKNKIRFLAGWQPPEILLKEMYESDIVVLPSYHELSPIILLEAMCLRKAIISTCIGGPRKTIEDGVTGLLINPFHKNELKLALTKLLTDSKLRNTLGSQAFATLKSKYEVSVVAPKFLRFLKNE